MAQNESSSAAYILPAREASLAALLFRKSRRLWRVSLWNTTNDHIEHGSWFQGDLHWSNCDISVHGEWMVYHAHGAQAGCPEWSGVCKLPWLRAVDQWRADYRGYAGGVFASQDELLASVALLPNGEDETPEYLPPHTPASPFSITALPGLIISDSRRLRDGWRTEASIRRYGGDIPDFCVPAQSQQPDQFRKWNNRPSAAHPALMAIENDQHAEFRLSEPPGLLDDTVTSAEWDASGQLLVARRTKIERYSLADMLNSKPSFELDLANLAE